MLKYNEVKGLLMKALYFNKNDELYIRDNRFYELYHEEAFDFRLSNRQINSLINDEMKGLYDEIKERLRHR